MNSTSRSSIRSRPEVKLRIFRGATSGRRRGFTLIELLVVIGIITFLVATIFANGQSFNGGQIEVENLAYDMGLTIRQAQEYGISVARNPNSGFSVGYGMYFTTGTNDQYTLFADANSNGSFDAGEAVAVSKINNNLFISDLQVCTSSSACTHVSSLNVLFVRPEPNAYINASSCSLNDSGIEICQSNYSSALIVVASSSGCKSTITVYKNGGISVSPTVSSCSH